MNRNMGAVNFCLSFVAIALCLGAQYCVSMRCALSPSWMGRSQSCLMTAQNAAQELQLSGETNRPMQSLLHAHSSLLELIKERADHVHAAAEIVLPKIGWLSLLLALLALIGKPRAFGALALPFGLYALLLYFIMAFS